MTDFNIIVGVQSGDALRELNKVQQGVTNVGAARIKSNKTKLELTDVCRSHIIGGLRL